MGAHHREIQATLAILSGLLTILLVAAPVVSVAAGDSGDAGPPAPGPVTPASPMSPPSFPIQLPTGPDLVVLEPSDPRTPTLAQEHPGTAYGLYEGHVMGTGQGVWLVETRSGWLGLVESEVGLTWITLDGDQLVPWRPSPGELDEPVWIDEELETPASHPTELTRSRPRGTLDLHLDGDPSYHAVYGDDWDDHQLDVIHMVGAIYERNLGIDVQVTGQHTWRVDEPTPMTAPDMCPFGPGQISKLEQYKDYKEARVPTVESPRDAAHVFIGDGGSTLAIGCAYQPALNTAYAYGVTEVAGTFGLGGFYRDIIVVAHELGHNFDGQHGLSDGPPCGGSIMMPSFCFQEPRFSGAEKNWYDPFCTSFVWHCQPHGNAVQMWGYSYERI